MKLALLNCDIVKPELRHIAGLYPDMFHQVARDMIFDVFNIYENHFPKNVKDYDGYFVNGSSKSVYDDIPWIGRLKDFVQTIYKVNLRFAGICFGHQMLAEALGGKVNRAPSGWCVGAHEFEVIQQEDWMQPFQSNFRVLMTCHDQILELPENSTVLAKSSKCPVGLYRVGENMLGIQGHPDFPRSYLTELMKGRVELLGRKTFESGIRSMQQEIDSQVLFDWLRGFVEGKKSIKTKE